jgi:hypothetical protein
VRRRDVVGVLVRDGWSPQRLKHEVVHPLSPAIHPLVCCTAVSRGELKGSSLDSSLPDKKDVYRRERQPARGELQGSSLNSSLPDKKDVHRREWQRAGGCPSPANQKA